MAEKIRAALTQPYALDEHEWHSTASIGISMLHGYDISLDEILKRADIAMRCRRASYQLQVDQGLRPVGDEVLLRCQQLRRWTDAPATRELQLTFACQARRDARLPQLGSLRRSHHSVPRRRHQGQQGLGQLARVYRLGYMGVHARGQAFLPVFLHRRRGHGNDGQVSGMR